MLNLIDLTRDKRSKEKGAPHGQKLLSIPIDCIRPNPAQPRRTFNEQAIDELAQSISRFGLLQPISVRKLGADRFELVAGERRLRAARKAGLTHINAIVVTAVEQESALLALIENLQREDLNYFDEAQAYYEVLREHGLTQEELARELGKNQSTIANKLRLLRVSRQVRELAERNGLSERHVRALLRLADEKKQLEIAQKAAVQALSVKQTETLVDRAVEEATNGKRTNVRVLHRDYRLFVNSIRSTVKQMNTEGLDANFSTKDLGESIEIKVIISKKLKGDNLRGRGIR
ncbi:MAG: ParB/RepB/Spo0J family partition protein [Bacillota bacterium]